MVLHASLRRTRCSSHCVPSVEHSVVTAPKQMPSCCASFLAYVDTLLTQRTWTKPSDSLPAAISVLINTSISLCARPNQAGLVFAAHPPVFAAHPEEQEQLDRSVGSGPVLEAR